MRQFKKDRSVSFSLNGSIGDIEQYNFMSQRLEDFENNDINPKNLERLLDEMQQQR